MATVNLKKPKSQPCAECGGDRRLDQEVVRRLRERLEYSELQNLKLSAECNMLRKELREAEFRGRSRSVHQKPFTNYF